MLGGSSSANLWGAGIMAVGALTDKFDGVLARRLNQVTEWGKVLDPLADKIAVAAVAIVLLILQRIPVWFVAVILVRDIVIFTGGVYLRVRRGIVLPSNEAGKWAVGIIALTLVLMVLDAPAGIIEACMLLSCVMLGVSFALYVRRFIGVLGAQKAPQTR